nr:putative ribonuclease H-like domain-containing protein [Tanacetum cinerariifolium]
EIRIDEGEVAVERTSEDTEEIATVLTFIDAATVLARGIDVPTGSYSIPTACPPVVDIHTGSDAVPTASVIVATATVVTPYSRRKGKEVMVESDTLKKQSIDWDKQTEEGNTEPRSLENFGMIARIKIESDADSEGEVVSANDAIPAGDSVSASDVATAVVSPPSETEFALMGLSTKAKWNNSGKNLYKLIDSSMSVRTKQGLGLDKYIGEGELGIDDSKVSIFHTNNDDLEGQPIYNRFTSVDHMKAVPPPLIGSYMTPSNIPDIDESQMVYGKKSTDSFEIKTNDDSISHSNDSVLFDFSDRSSEPSTNDLQTYDSSVECSRPNHSDHDSTDSISNVSTPASESRDTIVIDCDRQEDFTSVCTSSIETDVKSSKTLYDEEKDEEPFAGSNRGSKRRRERKEPESTSAPKEKTSKTSGKSTKGSKSQHKIASESAPVEEPIPTGSAGRPSGSADRTPEFSGPDVTNLESSLDVRSTITKWIHNIHPTSQVLGDINSPVQIRSQVKHKGSSESAFISYIHDQRRNNHPNFQLCMFSCFLSQEEPTTVAQALADPDWVEVMQAEMQQFKNQKVWVLVTLPDGKRPIGTKWILKNKKDARGIVCRNKARPDIMFAVCAAARHQVTPKTSNLLSVKRIFKYLTAYPKLGLWYLRDSPFDLEAFSDSDFAVATSSCEAEYVAAASWCGQGNIVHLWFLFTSAGRVTFCWLFPIPASDLVSAGHMLFLLIIAAINW